MLIKFILVYLLFFFSFATMSDVRDEYHSVFNKIGQQAPHLDLKYLQDYKIIFVTGYIVDWALKITTYLRGYGLATPNDLFYSFYDQQKYFKEINLDFQYAPLPIGGSCKNNANLIAQTIRESSKKVIIISHSKGGVDILEMLVDYPEIRDQLAGWISFQAPLLGSTFVDLSFTGPLGHGLLWMLSSIISGEKEAASCMTREYRINYYKEHMQEIDDFLSKIPTLAIGSYIRPKYFISIRDFINRNISVLNPFVAMLELYGGKKWGKNDGYIPIFSTCLKNTSCLIFPGMDHGGPVFDIPGLKSYGTKNRLKMTRSLIYMLLSRIENMDVSRYFPREN